MAIHVVNEARRYQTAASVREVDYAVRSSPRKSARRSSR